MKCRGLLFLRRRPLRWCPSHEACNGSGKRLTERWPSLRACGWRRAPIEAKSSSEKHFRFEWTRVIAKELREILGSHRCCFRQSGASQSKTQKPADNFAVG